jgi:uncharacterized protein with HEPN domain
MTRCGRQSIGTGPLPSDRITKSLKDILDAIAAIRRWVDRAGGIDAAVFDDELVRAGIERKLLVVSEAAIRIDLADKTYASIHAPEIDWRGVRGIGNVLRHR